jgi:hypothetical protein
VEQWKSWEVVGCHDPTRLLRARPRRYSTTTSTGILPKPTFSSCIYDETKMTPRYVGVRSKQLSSPFPSHPRLQPSDELGSVQTAALGSDYGGDFDTEDEEIVDALLDEIERKHQIHKGTVTPSQFDDIEDADLLAVETTRHRDELNTTSAMEVELSIQSSRQGPSIQVEYEPASRNNWTGICDFLLPGLVWMELTD